MHLVGHTQTTRIWGAQDHCAARAAHRNGDTTASDGSLISDRQSASVPHELFAFGKPWVAVAEVLHPPREPLRVGFTVASRRIRTYRLPGGQRLLVLWHSGSAGPPNQADTAHLKAALLADRS